MSILRRTAAIMPSMLLLIMSVIASPGFAAFPTTSGEIPPTWNTINHSTSTFLLDSGTYDYNSTSSNMPQNSFFNISPYFQLTITTTSGKVCPANRYPFAMVYLNKAVDQGIGYTSACLRSEPVQSGSNYQFMVVISGLANPNDGTFTKPGISLRWNIYCSATYIRDWEVLDGCSPPVMNNGQTILLWDSGYFSTQPATTYFSFNTNRICPSDYTPYFALRMSGIKQTYPGFTQTYGASLRGYTPHGSYYTVNVYASRSFTYFNNASLNGNFWDYYDFWDNNYRLYYYDSNKYWYSILDNFPFAFVQGLYSQQFGYNEDTGIVGLQWDLYCFPTRLGSDWFSS